MNGVTYDITERKAIEKQKDEFLSVASHELKTPVTSIKAYAELLRENFDDTSQEQGKIVDKLNNQVDRLIRLFTTLLDTTRLTEGRLELNPETFDLNEVLADQVDQFIGEFPADRRGEGRGVFGPARPQQQAFCACKHVFLTSWPPSVPDRDRRSTP